VDALVKGRWIFEDLSLTVSSDTLLGDDDDSEPPLPIMATKNSNESLHNEEFGGKANALHDEVLVDPELMTDAFMAENREHEMGLWVSYDGGSGRKWVKQNTDCATASDEGTPDGVFLGVHDVFHYRKSCSARVGQTMLTWHPTGHGILLHVLERQLRRPALLQREIRS
jgi:hypothetical protein